MKYICESCHQEFTPLDDDISDKKYCPKCQDPKKRAFRKEFFAKTKPKPEQEEIPEIPTEFEKLMIPYSLLNIKNFNDDFGKFKHMRLAVQIQRMTEFKTDFKTDIFYFYNEETGIWINKAKSFIGAAISTVLGIDHYKTANKNEIIDYIKMKSYNNVEFNKKKIALKNGYLDPTTLEMTPFNQREMVFYSLNVKYDPKAECPNWEVFIKDILDPEDALLLQEWSGYLLLPDYRYHKMMWIVGTGRNGKGVWARTMEAILGDHVSHVGLEELDGNHRFSVANLNGSLFNLCNEPTTTKVLRTQLLKSVTGQDSVSAELKGIQERFKFTNCAKFTVTGNAFPRVRDRSLAFRERTGFIEFAKEFIGETQIENLEQNWIQNDEELSGIFNWMLQGLQRVLKKHRFTESASQQKIMARFLRHSDSIQAWLNEACKVGSNKFFTVRAAAYEAYKIYCEEYGLEPETTKRFTQQLRETRRIYDQKKLVLGRAERVWTGLELMGNEALKTLKAGKTTKENKIEKYM